MQMIHLRSIDPSISFLALQSLAESIHPELRISIETCSDLNLFWRLKHWRRVAVTFVETSTKKISCFSVIDQHGFRAGSLVTTTFFVRVPGKLELDLSCLQPAVPVPRRRPLVSLIQGRGPSAGRPGLRAWPTVTSGRGALKNILFVTESRHGPAAARPESCARLSGSVPHLPSPYRDQDSARRPGSHGSELANVRNMNKRSTTGQHCFYPRSLSTCHGARNDDLTLPMPPMWTPRPGPGFPESTRRTQPSDSECSPG